MTLKGRRIGRYALGLVVLAGAGWYGYSRLRVARTKPRAGSVAVGNSAQVQAPAGVRIKVEVLNTTTTKGLARRGTVFLRERGFDVVGSGTVRERRDSTLILDRSGHAGWAALVAKALGARFESRPDSSRFVDVTVLLGADWRPPPLPFDP